MIRHQMVRPDPQHTEHEQRRNGNGDRLEPRAAFPGMARPAAAHTWLSPSKISLTLESSNTARNALAISGAHESTFSFAK